MRQIRFFLTVFCSLMAVACTKKHSWSEDPQVAAAEQLCERLLPRQSRNIVFEIEKGEGDFYALETVNGRLHISGSSVNALARGLGDYLRDWCHIGVTWFVRDKVREPRRLPSVEARVVRKALVDKRFFLNYCTYGYSLPWWKWEDWERLIDWMALHGVTLALANTGQESVWLETWKEFGLTEDQIRSYFTGPAYLPWHRMTNIDHWQGPLPQSWLDGQLALQKQIIARENSLGISPILGSFTGHVPEALKEKYPTARIERLNRWSGFDHAYSAWYLNPSDSLFRTVQSTFLNKQKEIFGGDCHIYGADLFNEVDPPSWEPSYLSEAARLTYDALRENDPEAIWLQMSWLFWHKRNMWTPERIEAYIKPVPKGRLIMLDYFCENVEIYRQTDNFYGQDFIWSYLGNFGGATMMAGDFEDISMKLDRVYVDAPEECVGIGCTLEGLDVNPIMYEYVLDRAWERSGDDALWIERYADRHSGKSDEHVRKAWKMVCEKVQKQKSGHVVSQIPARPRLDGQAKWNIPSSAYSNLDLLDAWGELLLADGCQTPEYRFDCVNWARQCLDNYFTELYAGLREDYAAGDLEGVSAKGARMMEILQDVDKLVASDTYFLMGKWISDARSWGTTDEEKDYFETNARMLLTCWGDKGRILNDYANRDWNGLIGTYYLPRWDKFLSGIEDSLRSGNPFDENAYASWCNDFEWEWAHSFSEMPSKPVGNPYKMSRSLYEKYSRLIRGL